MTRLNDGAARFIPAYAGNAWAANHWPMAVAVHPRIRGERACQTPHGRIWSGSSPHTRGTLQLPRKGNHDLRFIPAYAGNAQGHLIGFTDTNGSSPHTRGTPVASGQSGRPTRFIPAYAGNAAIISGSNALNPVHPRIRGERDGAQLPNVYSRGSSPHTRGTQFKENPVRAFSRFIPAYAGNACTLRVPGLGQTVHPRIRGERPKPPYVLVEETGSSPHTRGTQIVKQCTRVDCRFIPAYAGNALPVSY